LGGLPACSSRIADILAGFLLERTAKDGGASGGPPKMASPGVWTLRGGTEGRLGRGRVVERLEASLGGGIGGEGGELLRDSFPVTAASRAVEEPGRRSYWVTISTGGVTEKILPPEGSIVKAAA